jgi:tetratricopeptide (TPR) repeat protein
MVCQSLTYVQEALRLSTELEDEDLIRLSSADLGAVLLETNNPREAIDHLEKAEQLNAKVKDNLGLMKCTALLASCYRVVGDFERAQQYVKLTAQLEMQLKPLGLV